MPGMRGFGKRASMLFQMDVTFRGKYREEDQVRMTMLPKVGGQILYLTVTNCSMTPASGGSTPWMAGVALLRSLRGQRRGVSRKWR